MASAIAAQKAALELQRMSIALQTQKIEALKKIAELQHEKYMQTDPFDELMSVQHDVMLIDIRFAEMHLNVARKNCDDLERNLAAMESPLLGVNLRRGN